MAKRKRRSTQPETVNARELVEFLAVEYDGGPVHRPFDDLGERQASIDRYIGHSAIKDFINTLCEHFDLNRPDGRNNIDDSIVPVTS